MPAVENVWLNVAAGATVPLSKEPSSAVTVWPVLSAFVQVTVEPTDTPIVAGWNEKSLMVTDPAAAPGDAVGAQGIVLGATVCDAVATGDATATGEAGGGDTETAGAAAAEGHGIGLSAAGVEAVGDWARPAVAVSSSAALTRTPPRK